MDLTPSGPAEATIISTLRQFRPGDSVKAQNVGLPLQTVSAFVMKHGQIIPRGAVGELGENMTMSRRAI
jgi:hypothetical protein